MNMPRAERSIGAQWPSYPAGRSALNTMEKSSPRAMPRSLVSHSLWPLGRGMASTVPDSAACVVNDRMRHVPRLPETR
ncbi:hypothetical protein [Novosphingobium resinovorum]|uniref:hypothetical protein n=1 Tax=Novosphingobium resinovorum TaxID=158500 RepID=UPI003D2723C2